MTQALGHALDAACRRFEGVALCAEGGQYSYGQLDALAGDGGGAAARGRPGGRRAGACDGLEPAARHRRDARRVARGRRGRGRASQLAGGLDGGARAAHRHALAHRPAGAARRRQCAVVRVGAAAAKTRAAARCRADHLHLGVDRRAEGRGHRPRRLPGQAGPHPVAAALWRRRSRAAGAEPELRLRPVGQPADVAARRHAAHVAQVRGLGLRRHAGR